VKLAILLIQALQQAFREAFHDPEMRPVRAVARRHR
jgi:hypothetical protein